MCARLRFLAQFNPRPSRQLAPDDQVSFLPMEAVGEDGSLDLSETRAVKDVSQGYTFFEDGDVVIAKITPCFENSKGALMKGLAAGAGFGTTELIVLRPTEQIEPHFLYYAIQASEFRLRGAAAMLGAGGQKRIPDLFVKDFSVALPTRPAQAAIARYLDVETARIDALIAAKRHLLRTLEETRRSSVTDAITRGVRGDGQLAPSGLSWVDSIPKGWKTVPLKRFVRLVGGHTPATANASYWDGDVPWFSPKDMKADELHDSIDHVTRLAATESGLQMVEPETAMIVVRGMILAHTFPVCVTKLPATINQDMKALIVDDLVHPRFLPWLLRGASPLFLSLTEQSAHGTMALRTDRFMSEPLPIPPIDEQLQIVDRLAEERRRIDGLTRHVQSEMKLLRELRAATISEGVLGRIDISAHMESAHG